MAADRPNIVASISGAVRSLKGNIVALSQTVVEGYFTIIVVADFPASVKADVLRQRVEEGGDKDEFAVMVREYKAGVGVSDSGESESGQYILSATGEDRKGAIYDISITLGNLGINILDIATYLQGDQFVMVAQIQLPRDFDVEILQDKLAAIGSQGGFSIHLQHTDVFKETNRI
jgi:glycine cleavage system transcriptional repressor